MASNLEPLHQIEGELLPLLDSLDTCPEELRPELEAKIAEYLRKEITKIDRIGAVFSMLENVQSNAKAEIERLRARQQSAAASAERLERYLVHIIREREGRPLKGVNTTFSVRYAEAVAISNPEVVPAEFKRVTTSVDIPKLPLRDALKAGREVPGVSLQQREYLVRK